VIGEWNIVQQAPPVRSKSYESDDELEPARLLRNEILSWFGALPADDRSRLGMSVGANLTSVHFHSSLRVSSDGTQRFGLVVQLVEVQTLDISGITRQFPSGATLVIDVTGRVRFVIAATPAESRRPAMESMARLAMTSPMGWPLDSVDPFAVDYRGMHEARV
jgi:hypothetical protein